VYRREPVAVVRFGDAEARLLTTEPDDEGTIGEATRKLGRETGLAFSPDDVLAIKRLVAFAFDEADVLGIGFGDKFPSEHKSWMNRLAAIYAERVAAGRPPATLSHCLLNFDLLDALPRMLAGRRVSVISCRDLRPVLESGWGLSDVAAYQVPSQHMFRDVDDRYEAAMHDLPIWPDAHERVRSELTVREPGEVFLVGAGLFGKDLCIRVREKGGIALDMGSALDDIAGKITRGPKRRVLDLYARSMSVPEIAARLQRLFPLPVTVDDVSRIAAKALDHLAAWRSRPLQAAYPIVYFAALPLRVSADRAAEDRTYHLALGVAEDGVREPLGIWSQGSERAGFWLAVLDDLRERGVREVSVAVSGGPAGLAEALGAVFPRCTAGPPSLSAEGRRLAGAVAEIEAQLEGLQRAVDAHGEFPDQRAAIGFVYLVLTRRTG
jgi:hypothetical protein